MKALVGNRNAVIPVAIVDRAVVSGGCVLVVEDAEGGLAAAYGFIESPSP